VRVDSAMDFTLLGRARRPDAPRLNADRRQTGSVPLRQGLQSLRKLPGGLVNEFFWRLFPWLASRFRWELNYAFNYPPVARADRVVDRRRVGESVVPG